MIRRAASHIALALSFVMPGAAFLWPGGCMPVRVELAIVALEARRDASQAAPVTVRVALARCMGCVQRRGG